MRRFVTMTVLLGLALGAVASPATASPVGAVVGPGGYTAISGSGSTDAATLVEQWSADVRQFGLPVAYSPVGSSLGRAEFRSGTVDFAVTDVPYGLPDASGQVDPEPERPFAYVPLTAGGTALAFNLSVGGSRITDLALTGETVARIFTGQITTWDDAAIAATNPGLALPTVPILPVVRSDASGTTYLLTQWLAAQYPEIWDEYCTAQGVLFTGSCPATVFFPVAAGFIAQAGSLGVVGYTAAPGADGAITYVGNSYALRSDLPAARLQNAAGAFTGPAPEAVTVALQGATVGVDLVADLTGVRENPDPRSYPLSSYSYAVIPTAESGVFSAGKGPTLGAFLTYSLCEGQQQAAGVGFAPLTAGLRLAGFEQIARIPGYDGTVPDLAACGITEPVPTAEILVSKRKNRSKAHPLDGTNQRNDIYVFVQPPAGVSVTSVVFSIDGVVEQTEFHAPYDLNGGTTRKARPYNVSSMLSKGPHVLEAVLQTTSGPIVATAEFTLVRRARP